MNQDFNIIYWVKNPETSKNKTFSSGRPSFNLSILEEYNKKGFNVYKTVNNFIWHKRIKDDIAEIRACFIDIDYLELKWLDMSDKAKQERNNFMKLKYEKEVMLALKEIERLYNISPSEINITQKGFHIIYEYDSDCYFIDISLHEEINILLWDILKGDKNARDIARVYRIVDFTDWTWGNRGKIKEMKWKWKDVSPKKITKEIIQQKMNKIYKNRDILKIYKTFEKRITKDHKTNVNKWKINSIDSKEFVDALAKYFSFLSSKQNIEFSNDSIQNICNKLKYIETKPGIEYRMLEDDWKALTSGLYLVKEGDIFRFHDYSKHYRSTNLSFLSDWIMPSLPILIWDKWKYLNQILSWSIQMNLSSILEKKTQIDSKLFYDYFYGRSKFPNELKTDFNKNNPLSKLSQIPSIGKVYIALFSYIYDKITKNNKISFDIQKQFYQIEYSDFFDFAFPAINTPSKRKHHKKNLITILQKLSDVEIYFENETNNKAEYKRIIDITFPNISYYRGKKDFFLIKPLITKDFSLSKKQAFFNKNILTFQDGFGNTKITDFLLYAEAMLQNKMRDFDIKSIYVFEFLWLTGTEKSKNNTLRKHLKKAISVKYGFFKAYSINNWVIRLSKYKTEIKKNNKKKK